MASDSEWEGPEARLISLSGTSLPDEAHLAKKYRKVRSDSEEEDHIPLAELARRLKARKARLKQENVDLGSREITQNQEIKEGKSKFTTNVMETASENTSVTNSEDSDVSGPTESSDEDRVIKMDVNNVFRNKHKKYRKVKTEKRNVKKFLESLVIVL